MLPCRALSARFRPLARRIDPLPGTHHRTIPCFVSAPAWLKAGPRRIGLLRRPLHTGVPDWCWFGLWVLPGPISAPFLWRLIRIYIAICHQLALSIFSKKTRPRRWG